MGNHQTKEQLILAQNGDVAGIVEEYYNQLSLWLIAIASLLAVIIYFYIWNRGCKGLKDWLRKQTEMVSVPAAQFQQQRANVFNIPNVNRNAPVPNDACTVSQGYI